MNLNDEVQEQSGVVVRNGYLAMPTRSCIMSDTATKRDLLIVALQDLNAAELCLAERLGEVSSAASHKSLAAILTSYSSAGAARGDEISAVIEGFDAPPQEAPNIWMKAVLDDAARDAATIVAGPLRDIALAGALRKGAQAARVSYETAIELVSGRETCRVATAARDAHSATDAALMRALVRLAGSIGAATISE